MPIIFRLTVPFKTYILEERGGMAPFWHKNKSTDLQIMQFKYHNSLGKMCLYFSPKPLFSGFQAGQNV